MCICFPVTLFPWAITRTKIETLGVLCVILEPAEYSSSLPNQRCIFCCFCWMWFVLDSRLRFCSAKWRSFVSDLLLLFFFFVRYSVWETDKQTDNRISWGDFFGLLESYSYSSSGVWVSLLWACMMKFWIFLQEWWWWGFVGCCEYHASLLAAAVAALLGWDLGPGVQGRRVVFLTVERTTVVYIFSPVFSPSAPYWVWHHPSIALVCMVFPKASSFFSFFPLGHSIWRTSSSMDLQAFTPKSPFVVMQLLCSSVLLYLGKTL